MYLIAQAVGFLIHGPPVFSILGSDNTAPTVDKVLEVTLDFGKLGRGVAANTMNVAYWQLDGTHGNPHAAWTAAGSPQWPARC